MAVSNQSKPSAPTITNSTKNTVVVGAMTKAGQGWKYDQAGINYDSMFDSQGREVFYNSVGQATSFTNLVKNPA